MWKDEREKRSGKHMVVERASKRSDRLEKESIKTWCKNRSAENKSNYRKARNRTKKVVAKAMKEAAEEEMKVLHNKSNDVFELVKFMRKDGKDINGGGCMKDKDGDLWLVKKIVENYGRIIWKRS